MHSNFNIAYNTNASIQQRPTFKNKNEFIDNNLPNNLLLENIIDNYISIDSYDRSLSVYPDPFNYIVSFKPIGRSSEKTFKSNNKLYFDETPSPCIPRCFKNIKYISIDRIILPRHFLHKFIVNQTININLSLQMSVLTTMTKVDSKNRDNPTNLSLCPVCNQVYCICNFVDRYKYIILHLKEINHANQYSTNTNASDNSFALCVDKLVGAYNNFWFPVHGLCEYNSSSLFNLDKMTVYYTDRQGNTITSNAFIEYNITVNFNSNTYNFTYGLIFGSSENIGSNIYNYLVGNYPNLYIMKMKDLYNYNWFEKIFSQLGLNSYGVDTNTILSVINTVNIDGTMPNKDKLFLSIKDTDIIESHNCASSNNIYMTIGTKQNELNTDTKYS